LAYKMRPPILLYHRIALTTPKEDPLRLAVPPKRFRAQMRYLHDRKYRTGMPERFLKSRDRTFLKTVVITFDDGYLDTYTTAFPILQEFNFSAIIFLVSSLVGKQSVWDPNSNVQLMNWAQAREMSEYRIWVQSHTCTHPDLTDISARNAVQELRESKIEIEDRIGKPVHYLAYPYGRYDSRVVNMTEKAGYLGAFAAGASDKRAYSIERFEITMNDNSLLFSLKTKFLGNLIRMAYPFFHSRYSKIRGRL